MKKLLLLPLLITLIGCGYSKSDLEKDVLQSISETWDDEDELSHYDVSEVHLRRESNDDYFGRLVVYNDYEVEYYDLDVELYGDDFTWEVREVDDYNAFSSSEGTKDEPYNYSPHDYDPDYHYSQSQYDEVADIDYDYDYDSDYIWNLDDYCDLSVEQTDELLDYYTFDFNIDDYFIFTQSGGSYDHEGSVLIVTDDIMLEGLYVILRSNEVYIYDLERTDGDIVDEFLDGLMEGTFTVDCDGNLSGSFENEVGHTTHEFNLRKDNDY